jgi:maltose O-acetyltransferase
VTESDHPARRAARSLRNDLKWSWQALIRNTIAGSPLIPRLLRAAIYRLAGYHFETVNIGDGVILNNAHVAIGRDSSVSRGCYFEGRGQVTIEADVMVGQEVAFLTSKHEVDAAGTIDRTATYLPITIGAGSWIGARATVLADTTIGAGVVVTAGSVVSGVCTPGFVYGGVPARKIGRVKALARPASADEQSPDD